jgi:N-methylhydantoinase A
LRQVTVKRGLDIRDFTLVTFGGSGSLLACRLVDVLRLRGALIPTNPGNLSAYGLLTVDVRNDYVRTAVSRHSRLDIGALATSYEGLQDAADAALAREGFPPSDREFVRTADMRYYGQAYEVRVEVPNDALTATVADSVADAFHDAHRRLYGYDFKGDPRQEVEWVNLRVTGVGPIHKPSVAPIASGIGAGTALKGTREVYFDEWTHADVYDRARLGAGDVVEGPAVVEEYGATIPVHPDFAAAVDRYGNVLLTRDPS